MDKKNFNKMLLILAAGAALSAGKLVDKESMRNVNHHSRVELVNEENHNLDQTTLTAQKCNAIKEKMEKVFTELKIENLQEKPAQEQKDAALQILKYLLYNTTSTYPAFNKNNPKKETANLNQFDYEINLIYHSLCEGKNIDPKAECITLSFLYQMLGLDSKQATIQKNNDPDYSREIVVVNFADGERICKPAYTNLCQKDELKQNDSKFIFFEPEVFFNVMYKGYQYADKQNTAPLTTNLINTMANTNDNTLER